VPPPDNDADNTYREVTPVNTGLGLFSQAYAHDAQAHADRLAQEADEQLVQAAKQRVQDIRADIAAMNDMNDAKAVLDDLVVQLARLFEGVI
jgi:hypothetical protein